MATYFKKKSSWVVGLILGLVLPAFLLPFNHFHSEYSHPHPNQVSAYEHPAHFHSEVLEAYAHFINAHPSDPEQDKKYHQTHSSPNHKKDDVDFFILHSSNIPPLKKIDILKQFDFPVYFETPEVFIPYRVRFEIPTFKLLKTPRIYSSRSPPGISI